MNASLAGCMTCRCPVNPDATGRLVKNLAAHPEWEPVLFPPKPPASNPATPYLRPDSPRS